MAYLHQRFAIIFLTPSTFIALFRLYPKNDNAKSAVALTLPFISRYEPSFQRLTVPNGCSTIHFRFLRVFSSGLKHTITLFIIFTFFLKCLLHFSALFLFVQACNLLSYIPLLCMDLNIFYKLLCLHNVFYLC